MRRINDGIDLSASDLSEFVGCRHRTALDLGVAEGRRAAPTWIDPTAELLKERGLDHERAYAETLRRDGARISDLAAVQGDNATATTLAHMAEGFDAILQPALADGAWFGRPDVLRRVARGSRFGSWSYEVVDTKLSRVVRGGTILQLSLYSDLVGVAQGVVPEFFHVVTPDPASPLHTFRVDDFSAYVRLVRQRLHEAVQLDPDELAEANYPDPVEHCEVCRWWSECDQKRHRDDHLSLVANLTRLQSRELQTAGVRTLTELAALPTPLPFKPRRGAVETYERVREQARVQVSGRNAARPVYEVLDVVPDQGLCRLPAPSPGDLFLDLEGDPFARDGGREYLFGMVTVAPQSQAEARWAFTDAEECDAFEQVIDRILDLWRVDPNMHVYHYAPYEPAALKRLMGRYATREAEVDRMLRAGLFVDLYAVVRQGVRASVERYSIKDLEPFYGFTRSVALRDARAHLRVVERALELGTPDGLPAETREAVEGYNREDCLSALQLRDWLEEIRADVERSGRAVPRPARRDDTPPESIDERDRRLQPIFDALVREVPLDRAQRTADEQARWLLAHMLAWHRREAKAPWWEFFRLCELPEEELLAERSAISGLRFESRVGGTKKCPTDRYSFPLQDTDIRDGDTLNLTDGTRFGRVQVVDRASRTIEITKSSAHAETHASAAFAHKVVDATVLADAIERLASDVVASGLEGSRFRAAADLLLNRPPRVRSQAFVQLPTETAVDFAVRIAPLLDHTVLAIQGPPGAGKTHTGAEMIVALISKGMRVGVTAVSHKAVRNLLAKVQEAARRNTVPVRCGHKVTEKGDAAPGVTEFSDNAKALKSLGSGEVQALGGTAWLWAREDAVHAADVLFVDEAGQMSLTNALAASQAAHTLVLLGDPQQLEQPQQGSHPEGTDVSALEHILDGHPTIPTERGIFLEETWRLAPAICAFTSEAFYEGRLVSRTGLDRQVVLGTQRFDGSGLFLVPVEHFGNQNSSTEEVAVVEAIVREVTSQGCRWLDHGGTAHELTADDVLVIAPYNAHVTLLAERLGGRGVRVGTVDRFQGQEAPVVIYSMATSTPDDAPRGLEFLFSLNRFNVATSRARCACIVVATRRLFEPECRSPRQMELANAMCRYAEMSKAVEL